ncbi:MAG: aminoacyl-tRNA hydrolase [Candidatus Parcubacteria bacterium]|nr:aminoacyl-tRNA hydrolase [Candidatus Parcubacteria bacterium]
MQALIGLGNPDRKYQNNRHNAGCIFLNWFKDTYPEHCSDWIDQKKISAEVSQSEKLILVKPKTYMNESGKIINPLKKYFHLANNEIILFHDDSDLIIGQFKISLKKSSAGHHGVDSVYAHLKDNDIKRVRIGIRPLLEKKRQKAEDLVLKNFRPEEKEILTSVFKSITTRLSLIG